MMDACLLRMRRTGLGALILPLIAVALVAVLAAPSWAGQTVLFDPTGGGGVDPTKTIKADGFTWAAGNAVAIGAITPGVGPVQGTTFELKYQAILGAISGTTVSGSGVSVVAQTNDTTPSVPPLGGSIITGLTNTGKELTITADFKEVITNVSTAGGQTTLTFGLVPGAPNVLSIYSNNAGHALNFAGTGFDDGTLILQGTVIQNGGEGSYVSGFKTPSTGTGSPTSPVAFNSYSGDSSALTFWNTTNPTNTTSGSGSSFLPIQVDPSKTNTSFFPGGAPGIFQLSFNQVTTADPFNLVEPSKTFFGGYTPKLGATNGFSSTDVQFQVLAGNDFVVPEPASIIQALAAVTMIPTFLYFRRRRTPPTVA